MKGRKTPLPVAMFCEQFVENFLRKFLRFHAASAVLASASRKLGVKIGSSRPSSGFQNYGRIVP
jgi:hypothetical protein